MKKVFDRKKLESMLAWLRKELGELPLLVTFRTREEGGEQSISAGDYEDFLRTVMDSGQADLIDVELFRGEELLRDICKEAKAQGIKVIASSHDFEKTPAKEKILARLIRMQDCGADPLKLAVMPQTAEDVLTLLSATLEMKEQHAKQPVVTMSMGREGRSEPSGRRAVRLRHDLRKRGRGLRTGTGERAGAEGGPGGTADRHRLETDTISGRTRILY